MYQRLSVEDGDGFTAAPAPSKISRTTLVLLLIIFLETTLLLIGALPRKRVASPKLYTPVHGILEEVIQDPSPAVDQAWDDLQKYSVLRLPRSEAMKFPNRTSPIAGDPGYYMAELEVYHQLHCLVPQNQIRQALHPNHYPNWGMHTIHGVSSRQFYIDHCVERIRQGIMCNVDTSVLVWEWNPTVNETRVRLRVPHQCKNFTKIHEWTRENLLTSFPRWTHVPDDLPVPPIIY
ncbi:hypothetical protein R3P38DRAFT_3548294 [Favolaschia claudopus]|uniref:Uncharacterized protein n=1 Tax=Favolaschia claudopus TaxID=2862362 RepID=A0AAW0B672_9AGAR